MTHEDTLYSGSLEHREEAETPAILESTRCGLAFQLKDQVGVETIRTMEEALVDRAIASWTANPAILCDLNFDGRVIGTPRTPAVDPGQSRCRSRR